MNGTAFFPAGDGVWKGTPDDSPLFPRGGVLALGSDFGDVDSYDEQFTTGATYFDEGDGATWSRLVAFADLAGIPRSRLFCSNAWPCLREGGAAYGGDPPGGKDEPFTARCLEFFRYTIYHMRPTLILPLGLFPTRFVARFSPERLAAWVTASWSAIDADPVARLDKMTIVPIVHPSMPNHRHRRIEYNSPAKEAAFVASVIRSDLDVPSHP